MNRKTVPKKGEKVNGHLPSPAPVGDQGRFRIDRDKYADKMTQNILYAMDIELHRWVKIFAAHNDVTIAVVINQAVEFARQHTERITI